MGGISEYGDMYFCAHKKETKNLGCGKGSNDSKHI